MPGFCPSNGVVATVTILTGSPASAMVVGGEGGEGVREGARHSAVSLSPSLPAAFGGGHTVWAQALGSAGQ